MDSAASNYQNIDACSIPASSSSPPPTFVPPPSGMRTILCSGLDVRPRYIVVTHGLIVYAPLDAGKLEETLSRLIIEKLPRAGARIAERNGMYEYQIPHTFNAETPPVAFTATKYAEAYCSHTRPDLPNYLPDDLDISQPSIHALPDLSGYFRSGCCPTSFDAFLAPNTPGLHVQVTIFADLTFIGFTSSHILLDSLGRRTLLHAWTRLINGESFDDIPGMAWDASPFNAPEELPAVAPREGLAIDAWPAKASQNANPADPKPARKLVRMPKVFLENLKLQINAELQLEGSSEWVGSSDVLLAWWLKIAHGNRNSRDMRPISVLYPVDLRDKPIFPGGPSSPTCGINTPYINNAYFGVPIPLIPRTALRTDSLMETALIIRRAIIAFDANPDGLAVDVHRRCSHLFAPLDTLPDPLDIEFTAQSNCRKSQFAEMDFSGARAVESPAACPEEFPESGTDASKRPRCFVDLELMHTGVNTIGVVMAEDEDAVWMSQIRGVDDWERIRQSGDVVFV
ncbi:hypothetical protein C8R43DRAFT_1169948 [Mycena crocata]|nr:hypothetical protein C8R43DRAFT_1169948 [Mycena crocata]